MSLLFVGKGQDSDETVHMHSLPESLLLSYVLCTN